MSKDKKQKKKEQKSDQVPAAEPVAAKTEVMVVEQTGVMALGRPTNYSPEVAKQAEEYLNQCKDEQYTLVKTDGEKSTTWDNKIRVNLPSLAGLARYLKTSRKNIYEWQKRPEAGPFRDICEDILAEQEKRLIENGLSGDYNPNIAKLALGKHGYHDDEDKPPVPPQQNFFTLFINAANSRTLPPMPTPVEVEIIHAPTKLVENSKEVVQPVDAKKLVKELLKP